MQPDDHARTLQQLPRWRFPNLAPPCSIRSSSVGHNNPPLTTTRSPSLATTRPPPLTIETLPPPTTHMPQLATANRSHQPPALFFSLAPPPSTARFQTISSLGPVSWQFFFAGSTDCCMGRYRRVEQGPAAPTAACRSFFFALPAAHCC